MLLSVSQSDTSKLTKKTNAFVPLGDERVLKYLFIFFV